MDPNYPYQHQQRHPQHPPHPQQHHQQHHQQQPYQQPYNHHQPHHHHQPHNHQLHSQQPHPQPHHQPHHSQQSSFQVQIQTPRKDLLPAGSGAGYGVGQSPRNVQPHQQFHNQNYRQAPPVTVNNMSQQQTQQLPSQQQQQQHHQPQHQVAATGRRKEWIQAPLDVEEALQYTPMSSIVPFRETSIIIPLPTINTTGQIPLHDTVGEEQLSDLSQEAARDAGSQTVTETLKELSGYLASHPFKKYKFKRHPALENLAPAPTVHETFDIETGINDLMTVNKLGQFEGLLLKTNHQISFSTKAPESETPKAEKERRRSSGTVDPRNLFSTPAPQPHPLPQYISSSASPATPSQNLKSPIAPAPGYQPTTPQNSSTGMSFGVYIPQRTSSVSATPTTQGPPQPLTLETPSVHQSQKSPQPPPSASSQALYSPGGTRVLKSVMIASPPAFDRTAYSSHPDVDQNVIAGRGTGIRKRKRAADDDDDDALISGVDYRAKAQQAYNSLQNLMANIFNAEDNMQADTSERTTSKTSNYFLAGSYDTDSSHGPCLTVAVQTKLDGALQKVISAGKFHLLPVDDLVRLQKICENTLKSAEDIEIKVSDEIIATGDSSAWDAWLVRVNIINNALRTSMTCLRIMTGGRTEKQIYSHDLLQNILNTIKSLLDSCINQLIEVRPSSSPLLFKAAQSQKKILNGVLLELVLVFQLLTRFISAEEVTDEFITKIEYICTGIIFIDNATNDKDSIFGVQRVENLRVAAMDVLAVVFAKYPDQQKFIFDELLSNLEKLPSTTRGARNYKLASGGDIQLISALILILIQTSGTYRTESKKGRDIPALESAVEEQGGASPSASQSQNPDSNGSTDDPDKNPIGVMKEMSDVASKLVEAAQRNANYVASFMIHRAQASSKTGETPYRNLLDLCIADFLLLLSHPEWPAAEIMLRTIAVWMISICEDPKSQVAARGMALDILTNMAVSLCGMRVHLRENRAKAEGQNEYDSMLQNFMKEYLSLYQEGSGERRDEKEDLNKRLMTWDGPFKLVLEQMWEKDDASANGSSLRSAWGFFATLWGARLSQSFGTLDAEDQDDDPGVEIARVASLVRNIMKGNAWYDEQRNLDNFNKSTPTTFQLRHAYALTVMTTPFCMSFERLLDRFIHCVESDQISTRNKGLKAIKHLIEKDPDILDRQQTVNSMMLRSEDPSAQVRDSAVDMIGTCLSFKPGLEERVLPFIMNRVADTNVGVRKKAMRVSKEIYLNSENVATKVRVAECLMLRIKDMDAAVAELAKKTFEELWINPSYAQIMKPNDEQREISSKSMMIIKDRIDIIVRVAQGQDGQGINHLNNVIQAFLHKDNKQKNENTKICKIMVQALFDELLEHVGDSEKQDKQAILKTLTAFAKGSAKLFDVQQLETLRPYTENLSAQDDLFMYRSVIIIFRCVLPSLSSAHQSFLMNVAKALLTNLSHLSHRELKEVIFCLASINRVLDINARLVAVISSCFISVAKVAKADTNTLEKAMLGRISRFIYIMGLLGQHCDFEKFKEQVRAKMKPVGMDKFNSVSELVVDTILKFCGPAVEMSVRKSALESLGHVCKTHPSEYLKPKVLQPFDTVFKSDDKDLKNLVLSSILDFFSAEEKLSEEAAVQKGPATSKEALTNNDDYDPGRLTGATAFAASHDGVSTSLAQNYLKSVIKVALESNDEYALNAVEVIGSILRQGLVHPKECTPALIALETSTHPRIEQIAFKEHKVLTTKHESIIERSYMEGVRAAFKYQREIIGNVEGTKPGSNNVPILGSLYALAQPNRKVRKKLLHNMCSTLDFDVAKFNPDADPNPIVFSKFILYNLALFDYGAIEDVTTVAESLRLLVTTIGTTVVHQIESDIQQIGKEVPGPVDPAVRRQLCSASIVLMMAWSVQSYLRKAYGLNDPKRKAAAAKDATKAATKVQGVSSEGMRTEIGEMIASLDTDLGQDEQIRAFLEMLAYDKEFKLAAENEEELLGSGAEDDSEGEGGGATGGPLPKKRKRAASPSKKKKTSAKKARASVDYSD